MRFRGGLLEIKRIKDLREVGQAESPMRFHQIPSRMSHSVAHQLRAKAKINQPFSHAA